MYVMGKSLMTSPFISALSRHLMYNYIIKRNADAHVAWLIKGVDCMEKVEINKSSKEYGFVAGKTYPVLRNIMDECVVIMDENTPNAILSSKQLARYGFLEGTPELGGI